MQFDKDKNSKFSELFFKIRNVILSFEGVLETKKEKITTYSFNNKGLCHLRTVQSGVDIGFLKGVKMNDTYSLLEGSGKTLRVLNNTKFDEEIINDYIDQAIMLNK